MNPLILVVDDERDVLRMIETFLSGSGFEVVSAGGGEEAIRALNKLSRVPDLVVTDVVMPGMSGPMLVERLLVTYPDIRVLFMSGFDDRQVVKKYVLEKGFRLLPKPFLPKALLAAIRATLDVKTN